MNKVKNKKVMPDIFKYNNKKEDLNFVLNDNNFLKLSTNITKYYDPKIIN